MANYGDAGTVTGKAFRVKAVNTIATAIPLGLVDQATLADIDASINQDHLSGKQAGAAVAVKLTAGGKITVAIAAGPLPADPWHLLDLAAADVTPV